MRYNGSCDMRTWPVQKACEGASTPTLASPSGSSRNGGHPTRSSASINLYYDDDLLAKVSEMFARGTSYNMRMFPEEPSVVY